jgi:hypothetical protein
MRNAVRFQAGVILREQEFRDWLADQGFEASTQITQINDVRRIETHYGDLDVAYGGDNLEAIRTSLGWQFAAATTCMFVIDSGNQLIHDRVETVKDFLSRATVLLRCRKV